MTQISHDSFSLFHFPIFLATWATFFAAATVSFVAQLRLYRPKIGLLEFIQHCFPFEPWSKKSAKMDIFLYFASKFSKKLFATIPLLATVFISSLVQKVLEFAYPDYIPLEFGFVTIAICSIVVFVIGDLANYFSHYLQHFVPVLWELHKVHHSATFLNPLTTARMHPLGDAFDDTVSATFIGLPAGLFGFLYGFSLPDVLILAANANMVGTVIVLDALRHSHFPVSFGPLDRVFLSPHLHQVHHSCKLEHWDKNFGNKLSIWDLCFGTLFRPHKGEELVYGLGSAENQDYDKLTGIYVGPILKIWHSIVGTPGQRSDSEQVVSAQKSFAGRVLWRKPESQVDRADESPSNDFAPS